MFQEIIVFLIVGGAIVYLARQILGTFTSKKGCGKCDGCDGASPSAKVSPPQQLLQIQVKKKP